MVVQRVNEHVGKHVLQLVRVNQMINECQHVTESHVSHVLVFN